MTSGDLPPYKKRGKSNHSEEYKQKQREYNRARRAAMTPEDREAEAARRSALNRRRREADPQADRDKVNAWAAANLEKKRASARESYARHAEKRRAEALARHYKNREAVLARRKAEREANPEKHRARNHARRKHGAGALNPGEWDQILTDFNKACAYCHQQIDRLEFEHMTPISRGGVTVRDNIVPACPTCNRRKKARNILEFWPFAN